MKNTLTRSDLEDLSNEQFIAVVRYALTEQAAFTDNIHIRADLFDEFITRFEILKNDLQDAHEEINRMDELAGEGPYDDFGSADHSTDFAAELNELEETAKFEEFLDQLERDADEIGGDTGARIKEAIGIIADKKPSVGRRVPPAWNENYS